VEHTAIRRLIGRLRSRRPFARAPSAAWCLTGDRVLVGSPRQTKRSCGTVRLAGEHTALAEAGERERLGLQ